MERKLKLKRGCWFRGVILESEAGARTERENNREEKEGTDWRGGIQREGKEVREKREKGEPSGELEGKHLEGQRFRYPSFDYVHSSS